jgi:hypothetical protein
VTSKIIILESLVLRSFGSENVKNWSQWVTDHYSFLPCGCQSPPICFTSAWFVNGAPESSWRRTCSRTPKTVCDVFDLILCLHFLHSSRRQQSSWSHANFKPRIHFLDQIVFAKQFWSLQRSHRSLRVFICERQTWILLLQLLFQVPLVISPKHYLSTNLNAA